MTQNFEMEFFYVELKELDDNQKKWSKQFGKYICKSPESA